jgi:hypothetical protein
VQVVADPCLKLIAVICDLLFMYISPQKRARNKSKSSAKSVFGRFASLGWEQAAIIF